MTKRRWTVGMGAAAAAAVMTVTMVSTAQAGQDETAGPDFLEPAAAPDFLEPVELPVGKEREWSAADPTAGLPEAPLHCVEGVLPEDGTWHREYQTDLDTSATQLVTRAGDTAEAADLAEELKAAVAGCASAWLAENPGAVAGWDDHGALEVGDGGHLYAVYTAAPQSSENIAAFAIGQVGDTVTVVRWSEMGNLDHVAARDFEPVLDTALGRLVN